MKAAAERFLTPGAPAWCILVIALSVNFAAGFKLDMHRPMISDARQFLLLAQSLAAGDGYRCRETFWPDTPSMQRLPGWPAAVAAGLRLAPGVSPDVVMRVTGLLLNAVVAVLLFFLALRLFNRPGAALCAGLGYAFHPTGIYLAYHGLSEAYFLVLAASGMLLLLAGGIRRLAGFLLLGCACLERANFILWIVFFAGLILAGFIFNYWRLRRWAGRLALTSLMLGVILFIVPPLAWTARNYLVSGHFPIMSTLRGQTFYGGNNPVVAGDLKYWGYWVFPDQIPGETPQVELAKTQTEYEVDAYYFKKGVHYLVQHWFAVPRLLIGKLVRAYVPVPWKPSWGAYLTAIYRILIYLGAALGMGAGWRNVNADSRYAFIAMALTNVAMVLVFYGYARFSFSFEPFLLPFAGVGAAGLLRRLAPKIT